MAGPGAHAVLEEDVLAPELSAVMAREPVDVPRAALVIAKLEYPSLDPAPSLRVLQQLGEQAAEELAPLRGAPARLRIAAINRVLFDRERFAGNRAHYDDFRNSLLNVVLERRLGIPITLAVVYIDVARRAGLDVKGVAFPGHFLLRIEDDDSSAGEAVILDPFNGGVELDEAACRALLARSAGDEAPYDEALLQPCTARQLVARLLNNLKRTYVELRSFRHARRVTDLLLAADPTITSERRDRGLLSYHLNDFPAALSDLEDYVRLNAWTEGPDAERSDSDRDERDQIWEHIKSLRKRVAGMN
jgi:regulator of sirC expression with transglutaminase-like and TPR domain